MTKVFALLSVAAVLAFASCADKKPETTEVDTTAAVVVPVANDTTTAGGDTTTVAGDTTTKAAH